MAIELTDEEIVKALDICYDSPCCSADCPYFNKNGRNFCIEDKALYKDMKRIVQEHAEQKAEIERLTVENGWLSKERNKTTIECAELQKQVDALKQENSILSVTVEMHDEVEKQAVKDTADKIFDWLKSEVIMTEIPHGGEPSEEDVEAVMWWQIEEHFKKRYGVEVE